MKKETKVCPICKNKFEPQDWKHNYCNYKCRNKFYYKMEKAKQKMALERARMILAS